MRTQHDIDNPEILDYLGDVEVQSKNVKVLRLNFNDVVPRDDS